MSQVDSVSEGTALLSPTDPATLSGTQKIRWLFSLDTLTRKADVDEVLAREGMNNNVTAFGLESAQVAHQKILNFGFYRTCSCK